MSAKTKEHIKRTCPHCHVVFLVIPSQSHRRFCSKICADNAMRKPPTDRQCQVCGEPFQNKTRLTKPQTHCSRSCARKSQPHPNHRVILNCSICNKAFEVARYRSIPNTPQLAKYCSLKCSQKGVHLSAIPWAKGKTKETDPRLAHIAKANSQFYADHPEHNRGKNHPMFGKPMPASTKEKLLQANIGKTLSEKSKESLKLGQQFFKGKTAATDPLAAQRAKNSATARRGKPNPGKSAQMKAHLAAHPEDHINFILAKKGHETSLERTMRQALQAANIPFEAQYHLGRLWIDFALVAHRLAIEVDGSRWHDPVKDAIRDAKVQAMGWRIVHFTEHQITHQISACIEAVKRLL